MLEYITTESLQVRIGPGVTLHCIFADSSRMTKVRVAKAALTPSGFKFGAIFDRVKQLADETDRKAAVEHQKGMEA